MSFIGTTTGALVEQWLRAAEARGPVNVPGELNDTFVLTPDGRQLLGVSGHDCCAAAASPLGGSPTARVALRSDESGHASHPAHTR